MSCEDTREQMMELDAAAFDQLTHLQHCASCRALADQIRAAESEMGAHVSDFVQRGDFDAQWKAARAQARPPPRRRPRWWLLAAPALAAAAVLFVVLPPPPDTPEQLPVPLPIPEAEAPEVAAPAAPAPPEPAPRPAPRRPARPPPPPPPSPDRLAIYDLPAEATEIRAQCPSTAMRARVLQGRVIVELPSGEVCTLKIRGLDIPPIESGPGTYTYVDGRLTPR